MDNIEKNIEEIEDEEEEEEFKDPQITSINIHERKLARTLRILRRYTALRKLNLPPGDVIPEEIRQTIVEKQIDDSWELLQKKIFIGDEYITNIHTAADSREVQRRKEVLAERKRIKMKLDEECKITEEMFHKITEGWPELLASSDPLHIDNGLAQQKIKCDELLKRKNDLLAMIDLELQFKDTRYKQDERAMRQDIKTMADRIDRQANLMHRSFKQQLALIEEAIITERLQVLTDAKQHYNELYKYRDDKEASNLETKMQLLSEHEQEMYKLLQKHQEITRDLKITLGEDIGNLQKEYTNLRALCLLNSEMMDYNFQILKRREDENILVKSNQTRKINKLQDTVNHIRKKIADFQKESNNEIQKLTAEILKLNSNILEIENKADHFAKVNDQRYREINEMNLLEAQDLLKKILDIDKIIYEQQLGVPWKRGIIAKGKITSVRSITEEVSIKEEEISTTDEMKTKQMLLARILRLIASRTGFLIENRLESLLKPYLENDQTIINLDNVFAALHIRKPEEVDMLFNYFSSYTFCAECNKDNATLEEYTLSDLDDISPGDYYNQTDDHSIISAIKTPDHNITTLQASQISTSKSTTAIITGMERPKETIQEILNTVAICSTERQTDSDKDSQSQWGGGSTRSGVSKFRPATSSIAIASVRSFLDETIRRSTKTNIKSMQKVRCVKGHILTMNPAYVIHAIKDFSVDFNKNKVHEIPTLQSRLKNQRITLCRKQVDEDIRAIWEKIHNTFTTKQERIWDALLIGLNKYVSVLQDRKKICSEVIQLRKQNSELRQLLYKLLEQKDLTFLPPINEYVKIIMPKNYSSSSSTRYSSRYSSASRQSN